MLHPRLSRRALISALPAMGGLFALPAQACIRPLDQTEAGAEDVLLPVSGRLQGTRWRVLGVGDLTTPDGIYFGLDFTDDRTIVGQTPCNAFRADYTQRDRQLQVRRIMATRAACADEGAAQIETAFFAALEGAVTFGPEEGADPDRFDPADLARTSAIRIEAADGTPIHLVRLVLR